MKQKKPDSKSLIKQAGINPSRLLPAPKNLQVTAGKSSKKEFTQQSTPLFYAKPIHRAKKHDLL